MGYPKSLHRLYVASLYKIVRSSVILLLPLFPNDWSDAPKIPSGKGKRLIVLHAGTRSED